MDSNKILSLYKKLHDAGLVHNDVELRHIIWKGDTHSIKLIDFDNSRTRDDCRNDEEWDSWCKGEINEVANLLATAKSF